MKMRVAIVQPVLAPYVRQRLEELATDKNLEIYLFIENRCLSHRPGWFANEVKGCKVVFLKSFIKKEKIKNSQHTYAIDGIRSIAYKLPFLIKRYRPNVMLVCNATELALCYPLKCLLDYRIGLFVEDTLDAIDYLEPSVQKAKSFIYKRADFYLPMSDSSVTYLKRINIERNIYRTSWSIDFEHFSNAFDNKKSQSIKKELALNDRLVFLFVGRLIPQKGILNLLVGWGKLPSEMKRKLALVVVGTGPQRDQLQDFIDFNEVPNVIFVGEKNYEEMPNYYYIADAFILPTHRDLFSIVIMEAMACRLPILTTKYNGAKELIKEGKNGYIFDPTHVDNIRDVICKVYSQRKRLKEMGDLSLKIIRNYSHRSVINDFRKILYSVLESNNDCN